MGGGLRIYAMRGGEAFSSDDLVNTLDDADAGQVATVAEQEAYWNEWWGGSTA